MSLKAQSICFSQLKGDRLGEAIVSRQYPATGVWQADWIDFFFEHHRFSDTVIKLYSVPKTDMCYIFFI